MKHDEKTMEKLRNIIEKSKENDFETNEKQESQTMCKGNSKKKTRPRGRSDHWVWGVSVAKPTRKNNVTIGCSAKHLTGTLLELSCCFAAA